MGITTDTVESSVMAIETAISQVNETEDRSSTNLHTVAMTFQTLVENDTMSISRDAMESAIQILSHIQSWRMDNASLDVLHNTSAE